MTATLITAALLALMLFLLSAWCVAGRVKFNVMLGDGGNEELILRLRTQANFTEYVPMALTLILLLETARIGPAWLPAALGAVLLTGRLAHALGLLKTPELSAGRLLGMILTMLVLVVGAAAALGRGIGLW